MSLRELRPTERRCVVAYLAELERRTNRKWRVGPKLEKRFPRMKTPECVLHSGRDRVAVEVKALFDEESPSTFGAANALRRRLKPRVSGHHVIVLPRAYYGRRFRQPQVESITREIERVSPTLRWGRVGHIRVGHKSRLTLERPGSQGCYVFCSHAHHEGVRDFAGPVDGFFHLYDDGTAGQVYTDQAIRDTHRSLLDGCRRLLLEPARRALVDWYEEWRIVRVKGSGVFVMAGAGGWAGPQAIEPLLSRVLREADAKFVHNDWAPSRVVLIYDLFMGGSSSGDVREAFGAIDHAAYSRVHEVWLYSAGQLFALWAKEDASPTAPPAPSPPASG